MRLARRLADPFTTPLFTFTPLLFISEFSITQSHCSRLDTISV
jgi:hypothetical protein